jgi:replicative DNA helicase
MATLEHQDLSVIHNGDLEISFLGFCIAAPDITPAYTWLPSAAFYLDDHRKIWETIVDLYKAGEIPDMTRLAASLADRGIWTVAQSAQKVRTIVDLSMAYQPSLESVDPYFEMLVETYRKRRLDEFSYQMRSKLRVPNSNWKQDLQESFSEIFQDGDSTESEFVNMASYVEEAIPETISTGLADLDSLLDGGLGRGKLTVLAGRPSMGKSAVMCWLALAGAYKNNYTAMFSVEMPARNVRRRWLSCLSDFPYSCWKHIPDYKKTQAEEAFVPIAKYLSVNQMASQSDRILASLNREFMRQKIDLVFVDHLHEIITGTDNKATDEATYFATELRRLAKRHDAAIVLLAQINRGVEGRNDKRPTKADIRQFGAIEQIADVMIMLYRDEYYDPNTIDRNITEVIVSKNRDGATGTAKVLCNMATNRYYDLTSDNQIYLSRKASDSSFT